MPRSYVKWIGTLADVDAPIIQTLQYIREGAWSYRTGSPEHGHILQKSTQKLGFPASWSDPSVLPAYGGFIANAVWKSIGVQSRPGVGGLPCEIVHGNTGVSLGLQQSCAANTGLRALKAFLEALVIYLPVSKIVRTRENLSNLLIYIYITTILGTFLACTPHSSTDPFPPPPCPQNTHGRLAQCDFPFLFRWLILVFSLLYTDCRAR